MPPDAAVDVDVCARPAGVEVPAVPVPGMSCVYSFPTPPCSYLDNAHAGVKIDGVEIPRDTTDTNGWNTVDALGTFEIFGPGCDALTDGGAMHVTIAYKILI